MLGSGTSDWTVIPVLSTTVPGKPVSLRLVGGVNGMSTGVTGGVVPGSTSDQKRIRTPLPWEKSATRRSLHCPSSKKSYVCVPQTGVPTTSQTSVPEP